MDPVETLLATPRQFEEAYEAYGGRVYNLCLYMLASPDLAHDATQEVFMRAQRRFSTYDPSKPLSSWLASIASHHCVDLLRRRNAERRLFAPEAPQDSQPASAGPDPLARLLSAERGAELQRALVALPDRFRIPLVLAYYGEMSYDEIGTTLGVGRNTVGTLIFRGKQELRQYFSRSNTK